MGRPLVRTVCILSLNKYAISKSRLKQQGAGQIKILKFQADWMYWGPVRLLFSVLASMKIAEGVRLARGGCGLIDFGSGTISNHAHVKLDA